MDFQSPVRGISKKLMGARQMNWGNQGKSFRLIGELTGGAEFVLFKMPSLDGSRTGPDLTW
jgi:hypothetical protein